MPRMGKTEEDWNGWKLGFLKTVQPNSFSELISVVCNFKNNAWETYLFVSNLWFCHLHVNFFAYFKFHSDWGRVTGKIKQNELDCRDTAPLTRIAYIVLRCILYWPVLDRWVQMNGTAIPWKRSFTEHRHPKGWKTAYLRARWYRKTAH